MPMSLDEFTYLYNISSDDVKSRVLALLEESQSQSECQAKPLDTVNTV